LRYNLAVTVVLVRVEHFKISLIYVNKLYILVFDWLVAFFHNNLLD